jgi:hypothetical protein
MNAKHIESKFAEMGARLKVREIPSRWRQGDRQWISPEDFAMDIQHDGQGEFFEFRVPTHLSETLDATVMQTEPKKRQLLLLVRQPDTGKRLDRFLCGHDEREWFVAAVPGGASSVRQAMDALQPGDVRDALARNHVSSKKRYSRKNRAFRRQGEWFFVPEEALVVDEEFVLRDEPLRRGAGKPHIVEQLVRSGGEMVHVCGKYPNGVTEAEYRKLLRENPKSNNWGWRVMSRDPAVYARGAVRHSDHDTITLRVWHRVLMNTENHSRTMAKVAFLD